jgi:uncharacterized damage-inducible protein DinB
MTNKEIIEQFEKTWFYNRQVTTDFLEAIPEDKWEFTHHPKYAPLSKQFRHMTCVYGVYIDGFKNQAVDFSKKHSHYTGPLQKEEIKADLKNKDEQLRVVLNQMKVDGVENFRLDFFGVNMTFTEYTHVLIQHECMHIGIWSNVAAIAGFELPPSWKSDWGFK